MAKHWSCHSRPPHTLWHAPLCLSCHRRIISITPVHSVVVTPLPCAAATGALPTDYYEPHGVSPEEVVEAAMSLLLSLKVGRQTSGVLLSSQYPINYFSISQVSKGLGREC